MKRVAFWSLIVFLTASPASAEPTTADELLAALKYEPGKEAKAEAIKPVLKETKPASKETKAAVAKAGESDDKRFKKAVKSLTGMVAFARHNKMAVEYESNEQGGAEIYLEVDPKVKLKQAKKLSDLAYGDTVALSYVETTSVPAKPDEKPAIQSMVVTEITLLKKANPKALVS